MNTSAGLNRQTKSVRNICESECEMTRDRSGFRRQTETAMEPAFAELKSIRPEKNRYHGWVGWVSSALLCEWRSLLFSFFSLRLLYMIAFDLRVWILVPFFFIFYTHRAELWSTARCPFSLSLFVWLYFTQFFFFFSAWRIKKYLWCFLRLFFN